MLGPHKILDLVGQFNNVVRTDRPNKGTRPAGRSRRTNTLILRPAEIGPCTGPPLHQPCFEIVPKAGEICHAFVPASVGSVLAPLRLPVITPLSQSDPHAAADSPLSLNRSRCLTRYRSYPDDPNSAFAVASVRCARKPLANS
jgi:hypothetical protein